MNIRWMIRRDMPRIVAIEQQCFEFPWDEETFIRCLRQRNVIGMVIEPDVKTHKGRSNDINEPAGYMIYELHRNRLHLLNFATHPDYQRQGYGTALMDKLKSKLCPDANRRNRLTLEVRESNLVCSAVLSCMWVTCNSCPAQLLRRIERGRLSDAMEMP